MGSPLYFLHLPRTAGTSVTEVLDRRFRPGEIYPGQLLFTVAGKIADDLAPYRFFRGHFGTYLPTLLGWHVRVVTLVREPVSHVLSLMSHLGRFPWHPVLERPGWRDGSLSDKLCDPLFVQLFGNFQSRGLVAVPAPAAQVWRAPPSPGDPGQWRQFFAPPATGRPESAWGPDAVMETGDDAALAARVDEVLGRVDVVGTTDRADEAMAVLFRRMGWDGRPSLPVRNAADRPLDRSSLDASDLRALRARFAVDFDLYDRARCRLDEAAGRRAYGGSIL